MAQGGHYYKQKYDLDFQCQKLTNALQPTTAATAAVTKKREVKLNMKKLRNYL